MLESVQSIISRWKVLQPSIAALYWTVSEASEFLQVSCFQGISGQEFCLPWQLKKKKRETRQENKWCFAGCNFAKLEGCFILFTSNPDQHILLWNLTHNNKPLSKPHPNWERQRRWFYNILPDHNILFSGAGHILLLHLCVVLYKEGKGQGGDKSRAEVGTPSSRTLNWHSNKLKSKQNCSCLYKQLDCTLREDKGMKLCPYKVMLIFYLSNKKKHRREVRGCWRKNTQVLRPEKLKTKFNKDRNICRWSTQKTPPKHSLFFHKNKHGILLSVARTPLWEPDI